jgi:uncharacterized protein (DUF2336 family)
LARRPRLGVGVVAALAEIGEREAVIALADNLEAELSQAVLSRIVERFGEDARTREALLMRPSLPATLRCDLVGAAAEALSEFVAGRNWLSADRAQRIAGEAAEQGVVSVANASRDDQMRDLARHLRHRGRMTIALLLRALLSGNRALVEHGFAELSGLSSSRVAGFLDRPRSAGFAALYRKTALPAYLLPVFRAALDALAEARIVRGERLSWALTKRLIESCAAIDSLELGKLMSLLHRFEAEAAREEARLLGAESAIRRQAPPLLVFLEDERLCVAGGNAPPVGAPAPRVLSLGRAAVLADAA